MLKCGWQICSSANLLMQEWQHPGPCEVQVIKPGGKLKVEIDKCVKTKHFIAMRTLSIALLKMKTMGAYMSENVTDAVIIILACFNNSQSQATINVGKMLGLNVLYQH